MVLNFWEGVQIAYGQTMAESDFFTEESLRRLAFDTPENAYNHLQIQAMKHGFEIATSQSHSSTYMTIYCTKGGKSRGANTVKTGCEWKIALKPVKGSGVVIGKITSLQHNHLMRGNPSGTCYVHFIKSKTS